MKRTQLFKGEINDQMIVMFKNSKLLKTQIMKTKPTKFFLASLLSVSFLMTACVQTQTSNPKIEIIEGLYEDFAAGDGGAVLATFSPDIVWNEAESNSLADRNPYIGPQAVAEGVFGRVGQEWETFTLTDQTIYAVGEDMVLATGRYRGTHATTGKSINAQHVHIWWFEDGMITRFQQYVDTKQLADAEAE
jgi:ketosteroid isomerase-like protein